jgi:dihydropteroate synthase
LVRKRLHFQAKDRQYILGDRTWIIGVLNITPDSFYDGGFYFDKVKAIERALELVAEGADIIDIGGESSRPGSDPIPAEEEMRRVLPVISDLRQRTQALISIDTTKYAVAKAAVEEGADIINDISSLRLDPKMLSFVAESRAALVLMHMKGTPKTMQINPSYQDLLGEIKGFLEERMEVAQAYGVPKENLIIDPGIGFAKNPGDNLSLINKLNVFAELDRPILIGASRKSFIGKILNEPPQTRLEGSLAAAVMSIVRGAHILRVHDVLSTKKAVLVAEAILSEKIHAV